jgi:hypothetical protein
MVRLLILMIIICAAGVYPAQAKKENNITPQQVIQKEIECLTTNDYLTYSQLWT